MKHIWDVLLNKGIGFHNSKILIKIFLIYFYLQDKGFGLYYLIPIYYFLLFKFALCWSFRGNCLCFMAMVMDHKRFNQRGVAD